MNTLKSFLILNLFSFQIFAANVFINQAGYLPNLPKYFYYSGQADSFYIIEKSTGTIYYSGTLVLSVKNDPATALTLYKGDFSDLEREGIYFVKLDNGDSSFSFEISSDVFRSAMEKSLKEFYYQRCGIALTPEYAGEYNHPACHLSDAVLHSSTGESGFIENTGGWHDAGDYGKYVINAGITVGTLLMAYEYFPERFDSDNLNIPETGNGIPDILDEVRFELEWLFKMQRADGGVYFKLTGKFFEPFIMPQEDKEERYIYQVSSPGTGNFAAIMARASRIFSIYDSSFAKTCLEASILAWKFLSEHPHIFPQGGFRNPIGTNTGYYYDYDDSDERLWAAVELFESTAKTEFHNYFIDHYNDAAILDSTMWWRNVKALAQITYLFSKQSSVLQEVTDNISISLLDYCNSLKERSNRNGFGITINPGEYVWGCNSEVLNNAILLIFGFERSGNSDFYNKALTQLNYILGANALNKCFVTGVGSEPVMNPHHRPSGADKVADPVPGIIAGGPNQNLQDALLDSLFNNSTPPALCYVDHVNSYASNENAINWNAALVFVVGYFNSEGKMNFENDK